MVCFPSLEVSMKASPLSEASVLVSLAEALLHQAQQTPTEAQEPIGVLVLHEK
jgi:hypothetical protein